MRFLVDQCLAVEVAEALRTAGHDVAHVSDRGMQHSEDPEILGLALSEQRVLVSADTDFGTLLARSGAPAPSVVLFRRQTGRQPHEQAALLLANLASVAEALDIGSVVVIEENRLRVRRLPIRE